MTLLYKENIYYVLGDETMGIVYSYPIEYNIAFACTHNSELWKDGEKLCDLEITGSFLHEPIPKRTYTKRSISKGIEYERKVKKLKGLKLEFFQAYGGLIDPDKRPQVFREWLRAKKGERDFCRWIDSQKGIDNEI